ncbi:MAG: hypothetical protein J6M31_07855 [Bacteroidales bacterium]|nr:hypothetical protein [Bacteroidales bacterium]
MERKQVYLVPGCVLYELQLEAVIAASGDPAALEPPVFNGFGTETLW